MSIERECIYCRQKKWESSFDSEHVIPESLGTFGAQTPTLSSVCKECNKALGDELVSPFLRRSFEGLLRYGFGLKQFDISIHPDRLRKRLDQKAFSTNIGLPPVLTQLKYELAGMDEPFHGIIRYFPQVGVWPDMVHLPMFYTQKELVEESPDLSHFNPSSDCPSLLVCATDEQETELRRLAAKCGLPTGPCRRIGVPERSMGETTVTMSGAVLRFPVYLAFNFAAYHFGAEAVLNNDFDEARDFVRWSCGKFHQFLEVPAESPFSCKQDQAAAFGSHFVGTRWSDSNSLVAQVSLFGWMHYRVRLIRHLKGLWRADWIVGRLFDWRNRTVTKVRHSDYIILP